jgi:hypothetical protein
MRQEIKAAIAELGTITRLQLTIIAVSVAASFAYLLLG